VLTLAVRNTTRASRGSLTTPTGWRSWAWVRLHRTDGPAAAHAFRDGLQDVDLGVLSRDGEVVTARVSTSNATVVSPAEKRKWLEGHQVPQKRERAVDGGAREQARVLIDLPSGRKAVPLVVADDITFAVH
jgi:hypothetical protein